MKGMVFVALLLTGPAVAGEASNLSHDELCIWRAASLIDPKVPEETARIVADEIATRGESCSDPIYMQAAQARLANAQRQADVQTQSDYQQRLADEDRRHERAERIRAAGRAILQQQQDQRDRAWANRPTTTTCNPTMGSGVICTTN